MTVTVIRRFSVLAIPVVIFFSYLFLAIQPDLGLAIPELVGICGFIVILLAVCQVDHKAGETGFAWSPMFILLPAAVFRAIFLWRAPELSDDIYRYLFDGLMTFSGTNPYLDAPVNIMSPATELAELVPLINHSHLATIYPPAAQAVFAAGIMFGKLLSLSFLSGVKLFLVTLDLFSCAIIIKILMNLNLSKKRAVLYAWHPLPVIEIAGSGHIDAAAIFFLMTAIGLVIFIRPPKQQGRGTGQSRIGLILILAGGFMAFSTLTKWLPLVFLPGLWLMVKPGNRRYMMFGCLGAAGMLICPFLPEFANGLNTLNTYLRNWEFSGFAFRQLRRLGGSGESVRLVLASGFIIIAGHVCWRIYREKSHLQMLKSFLAIGFAYLFFTPTLHPWYALYLTVFLPFVTGPAGLTTAGLTFSWAVFLAYRVLIPYKLQGVWIEDDFNALLIVLAPAASFLAVLVVNVMNSRLRRHINERKAPVVAG